MIFFLFFDAVRVQCDPVYAIMRDTLMDFGYINFQPVIKALGGIPVKRAKDHQTSRKEFNKRSIAYAASLVANGCHMLFYPQGTRRPDEVGEVSINSFNTLKHLQGNDPDVIIMPTFISYHGPSYLQPGTVVHFGDPYIPQDGTLPSSEMLRDNWVQQMENFFEMEKDNALPHQR